MAADYARQVADLVSKLPVKTQAEVLRFTRLARRRSAGGNRLRKARRLSVFSLFGSVTGTVADASINHDRYLYE